MKTAKAIPFNAPMVRAILEGRKTQTRRIIKPQPLWIADPYVPFKTPDADPKGIINCPHGQIGGRLWVREPGRILDHYSDGSVLVEYQTDYERQRVKFPDRLRKESGDLPKWAWSHQGIPNGIFKEAARIFLEVTAIRVERLRDISEEDARAEGITDGGCLTCGNPEPCGCANPNPSKRETFAWLWTDLYGSHAWNSNPWVWVIEFKRIEQ